MTMAKVPPPSVPAGRVGPDASRVVLVLSGGSALGAFQGGAYEVLHAAGLRPDWLVATSIGAVNAALIAGNPADRQIEALRRFWTRVARPGPALPGALWQSWLNLGGALRSLATGRPGLFLPRPAALLPWVNESLPARPPGLLSLAPLRETLEALVDFERLNRGDIRVTVTAVDIDTGEVVRFDTTHARITPEHLVASASMPPEFPPVRLDGRWLCDGALAQNAPVDVVLEDHRQGDRLGFILDLFDRRDGVAASLDALAGRREDLMFAHPVDQAMAAGATARRLRRAIAELAARLPEGARRDPALARWIGEGSRDCLTLVHLRHTSRPEDVALKMYDYSAASLADRWAAGARTAARALDILETRSRVEPEPGLALYEVRG